MRINIDLNTQDTADLTALTALVAALGGKGPSVSVRMGAVTVAPGNNEPGMTIVPEADDDSDDPSPVAPANADDRDVNGLPWDERIHASSRTRNADGSWRQRRGVDTETVARITESLKLGEAARSAPQPDAPPAPPVPSNGPEAPAPTASEPPAAPAAEPAAPPPPVAVVGSQDDPNNPHAPFQALMKRVGAAGLVYTDLNAIAQQAGFAGYPDVAKGGAQAVATFTMMAEAMGKLTPVEG